MKKHKLRMLYEAYYDIKDEYYVEIAIWGIQFFINFYFYRKYLVE